MLANFNSSRAALHNTNIVSELAVEISPLAGDADCREGPRYFGLTGILRVEGDYEEGSAGRSVQWSLLNAECMFSLPVTID